MYKRSPAPFVPPIPPDVTSSSESSPVMQSQGFPPDQPTGLGRPGMVPQLGGPPGSPGAVVGAFGYPAFNDYAELKEFRDFQEMSMMQRWQQTRGGGGGPQGSAMSAGLRSPGPPSAAGAGQVGRPIYGGAPTFGYTPAPPQIGYGYSPYPQPSPYTYQAAAAAGGFPFGGGPAAAAMYGAPAPFATPFMTPLPTQTLLDPVGQPPGGALMRPGSSMIGRPGAQVVDMAIGKWFPGPEYAPVLDHLCFNVVKPPTIEIHPLLRPISESRESTDPFLVFDVLFPPNTIHVSTEPPRKSWSKGRKDPATFPRMKVIRIISRYTPWVIQVMSDSPSGITVSDVIGAVHEHFRVNASEDDDWNSVDPGTQSEILMAYKWNRSTEMGAPGGIMPEALLRGDFLMERTMFAGLKVADPDLCEEKMDVKTFPATFELLLHTR
ncbi:hypothetical protein FRB99_005200 [Tulasnella sp. 403]|nr:hypothetical protein FRB99_005200 [Tulasnella sp. 403]